MSTDYIRQAAQLVKSGDKDQAFRLLKAHLKENPDDWRGWWGMVHAASEPRHRLAALKKTLKYNPDHAKAQSLLEQLEIRQQRAQEPEPEPAYAASAFDSPFEADPQAPFPNTLDPEPAAYNDYGFGDEPGYGLYGDDELPSEDPFGSTDTGEVPFEEDLAFPGASNSSTAQRRKSSGGGTIINVLIGVVVVLIIGVLAFALLGSGGNPFAGLSSLVNAGAPNSFDGGDGLRTTGGGVLDVNGGPVNDRIHSLMEGHNWGFQAQAGQQVHIVARGQDDTDPRIKLLDPNGAFLAEIDDNGADYNLGYYDAYLTHTIPQDGLYTVRVDIWSEGAFTLEVSTR